MSKFNMMGDGEFPKISASKKPKVSRKAKTSDEAPTVARRRITTARGTDILGQIGLSLERDSKMMGLLKPSIIIDIIGSQYGISNITQERFNSHGDLCILNLAVIENHMSMKRVRNTIIEDYLLHVPAVVALGNMLLPITGFRFIDAPGVLNFNPNKFVLVAGGNTAAYRPQVEQNQVEILGRSWRT